MKNIYVFTNKEIRKVCDCNTRLISATNRAMESIRNKQYNQVEETLHYIRELCYEQENELMIKE